MEGVLNRSLVSTKLIVWVSVLIPVAVAILLLLPQKIAAGSWVYVLPDINAIINSLTSLLLVAAFVMIKQGNIQVHRTLMTMSLFLGLLFLISYVIYHASAPSVKFGDSNNDGVLSAAELAAVSSSRGVYLFFLLSHILLSIVVVPFVLFAFYFALTEKIDRHKKLVKFTFPIWLYVSVTGVVVYFMIRNYYSWV